MRLRAAAAAVDTLPVIVAPPVAFRLLESMLLLPVSKDEFEAVTGTVLAVEAGVVIGAGFCVFIDVVVPVARRADWNSRSSSSSNSDNV